MSESGMDDQRAVGKALAHESALLHVTGRATYVEDLATRTANTAYAWPIQSPHAHAHVRELDFSECRSLAVQALSAADGRAVRALVEDATTR